MILKVSKKQARIFLLKKQLLYPPQSLSGPQAVDHVFQTLRTIQYDPLNPCGRNTDLVLQARIKDYHPSDYQTWLYKQGKGIELYDKEMCIFPIEDLYLATQTHTAQRRMHRAQEFIKEHQEDIPKLLELIESQGPISSLNIKDDRKVEYFWNKITWGNAALETLWRTGQIVIANRINNRRFYDLPEKVYAQKLPWATKPTDITKLILRRLQSLSLLPKTTFAGGTGWQGLINPLQAKAHITQLLNQEILTEVQIEGVSRSYVINTLDIKLLTTNYKIPTPIMAFIAPLDNLIWDRQLIRDIFNFDYKWEVYNKQPDRKFGYYVLPILYGDELIGRIEPVLKNNTLKIKGLWKEPTATWDKKTEEALKQALKTFQSYIKTQTIKT